MKKGFTIIESLLAVSMASILGVTLINTEIKENKNIENKNFSNNINELLSGVDYRLSVDGYDYNKWTKKSWTNNELDDLIKKQLQAINSSCKNGAWTPINPTDDNLKLVSCDLFYKRPFDLEINAKIEKDGSGYINKFNVDYSFKNNKDFNKYFSDFNKTVSLSKTKQKELITGTAFYKYIDKSNGNKLNVSECIKKQKDCVFRTTLDRVGGSESVRVDGLNSMIGSSLSFLKTKDDTSPLKCVKWSKDNTGVWSNSLVNCGVGIYPKTNQPVVVEAAAKNGTFETIFLSKKCSIFNWDASTNSIIESNPSKVTPCGLSKDGTFAIQLIDNIHAQNGYLKNIYSNNGYLNIANINEITSKLLNVDVLKIKNSFISNGTSVFNGSVIVNNNNINVFNGSIETNKLLKSPEGQINRVYADQISASNVVLGTNTKPGFLTVNGNQNISGFINSGNEIKGHSLSSDTRITAGEYLELKKQENSGSGCSENGLVSRDRNGALLSCTKGKWELASGGSKRFKQFKNVGTSFKANASGILVFISGWNSTVGCVINGETVFKTDGRDKYGQGVTSGSVPIAKNDNVYVYGASSIRFRELY